jgi:DnaJ-class molecular chaperone
MKPYLRQLTALKANLAVQLRELEDSRAFFALGVSKEASEAMIKKAYHSKAIRLREY